MFEASELPEYKADFYRLLEKQTKALTSGEEDTLANLANVASLLFTSMAEVNWAGFYIVRGEQLVLGPFMGKPACVRIPLGRGVCGNAVIQKEAMLVNDVDAFPGHIACDADSRSEIVIPLLVDGNIVGVLDIDSPVKERFDQEDRLGLEAVVEVLQQQLNFNQLSYSSG